MITTNGANILLAFILKGNVAADSVTDITGAQNASSISISALSLAKMFVPSSSSGVKMYFGASDKAESPDDYVLDDPVISSTNGTCGKSADKWFVTTTFTNNGSDPLVIKEIGVTAGTQSNNKEYLIARKVVPARTVAVGETATFTFTLDF